LLLFEAQKKKGMYRFQGTFACTGYEPRPGIDSRGRERELIVFNLMRVSSPEEYGPPASSKPLDLKSLRAAAIAASRELPEEGLNSKRTYFKRSAIVRDYVLARAKGICESCKNPAPFRRRDGRPYLEPHHTHRLADGGPDHPNWVAAICPACHREIHHGENGHLLNDKLILYVATTETILSKK
jgi:5-methylcytosine-specific restriction protein A